jgi:two-component system cell cycle sensor histidine kinase/response regulator CckA
VREIFERAFAASPAGLAIRNLVTGQLVEINEVMCRVVGCSRQDALGTSLDEWDPIDPADRARMVAQLAEGATVAQLRVHFTRPDGTRRAVLASVAPMDLDGIPHYVFSGVDVTDHELAEARFQQIAETIDEVFWMTDAARTRVVYVSPAYERIWGRTCASLYDAPLDWLEAIHPDDRERVSAAMYREIALDETFRIVRPCGGVRWIHDRAFPVRDGAGAIVGIAGVAADITDTRVLEQELRQTQKLESIGLLAGGVAHDFNNLLTVVSTCADELGWSVAADEPVRELVDEVREAVARGASLTRQLLAFSRRQVLEPRRVHLDQIVSETDKMLRRLLGEDVTLTTVLRPGVAPVIVDAGQITQVLVNLAVNARDAMPRGGSLRIETTARGDRAVLIVSDTGSGMADDVRARIFEPFFTTKGARGTGLGLSVTRGIVAQCGGTIEVDSELDVGTRFTISLPAATAGEADEAAPAARGSLVGTETVLVVEDQETVRRAIGRILRARGYRVLEAGDGRAALAMLAERGGAVDLVVTDIVMPEMDGRQLAEAAQRRWNALRFLFCTGYTGDEIVRRGVLQTELPCLQKPFESQVLLERVRDCLDQAMER